MTSEQPRESKMAIQTLPPTDEVVADQVRLQGVWQFLAGQRVAELRLDGNRFTVQFQNGERYRGTYWIDPTRWPKAIDMAIEEGPEPHRGLTSLGIYKLEDKTLRWSPGEPGKGRPRSFPTDTESRQLDLFFKRQE